MWRVEVELHRCSHNSVAQNSKDMLSSSKLKKNILKGNAIPVTGHEGPQGCETSKLPHFLDNRLTDGGEVVSITRRPFFTPRKIPDTHFC
jgi:hypothetical protein